VIDDEVGSPVTDGVALATTTLCVAIVSAADVYSIDAVATVASPPRPEKVATPVDGVAEDVSTVLPPEVLTVAVTAVAQDVTVFPAEWRIVITGCVGKSVPYVVFAAGVVIASDAAVPGPDGVIDADVTDVNPDEANVRVCDVVVRPANVRFVNVAVPDTPATPEVACAPPNVPPEALTVTVAVDDVAFPYASTMVTTGCVLNNDPDAPATGCVAIASLFADAAETVTDNRSDPVAEIDPSVTDTVADSARYSTIAPVATPEVNVNDVEEPNDVPATVGAVTGLLDDPGPENVSDFDPVYEVAVFPLAS